MTSIRSQAAPLPTFLEQCVAAYATGNTRHGEHLFAATRLEILPLVRRVIQTRTDRNHEDIEQDAVLKIWVSIRQGIMPDIQRLTYHAVVSAHRKASGMGDSRGMTAQQAHAATNPAPLNMQHGDNDDTQHRSKHTAAKHADPSDTISEAVDAIDAGLIADTLSSVDPLWGVIALLLAEGKSQNSIARRLGMSRWIVNGHVDKMREYLENAA